MFWMVPIFYAFSIIPAAYCDLYKLNPLATLILALRNILIEESFVAVRREESAPGFMRRYPKFFVSLYLSFSLQFLVVARKA
jgi:ABC-type polysaccharide/polyol phosphate export permease